MSIIILTAWKTSLAKPWDVKCPGIDDNIWINKRNYETDDFYKHQDRKQN